jgi:hypothetical protein
VIIAAIPVRHAVVSLSGVLAWYIASGHTAVRFSLRRVQLSRRLFAEILRVGAPMSLQPILNNLSLATLTGCRCDGSALPGKTALNERRQTGCDRGVRSRTMLREDHP